MMTSTPNNANIPPTYHAHNGTSSSSGGQLGPHHLGIMVQSTTVAPLNGSTSGVPPTYATGNGASTFVSPPLGEHAVGNSSAQGNTAYMQQLTQEIEKERVEYQAKSRHIEQQLAALKSEIEDLKVDEKMTPFDHLHTENSLKGGSKYSTMNMSQEATPQQRLQYYDEL